MKSTNSASIPAIVKHMTIAIYRKGGYGENKLERFQASFAIARGKLTAWGFLQPGGDVGPITGIKLTAKGVQRNAKHTGDGADKSNLFDSLYADLQDANKQDEVETTVNLPTPRVGKIPVRVKPARKPVERKLQPKPVPSTGRKVTKVTKAAKTAKAGSVRKAIRTARAKSTTKARKA